MPTYQQIPEASALELAIRFHSPAAGPVTLDQLLTTAAAFRDFLKGNLTPNQRQFFRLTNDRGFLVLTMQGQEVDTFACVQNLELQTFQFASAAPPTPVCPCPSNQVIVEHVSS